MIRAPGAPHRETASEHIRDAIQLLNAPTLLGGSMPPAYVDAAKRRLHLALEALEAPAPAEHVGDFPVGFLVDHRERDSASPLERRIADVVAWLLLAVVVAWLVSLSGCAPPPALERPQFAPRLDPAEWLSCPPGSRAIVARPEDWRPALVTCDSTRAER